MISQTYTRKDFYNDMITKATERIGIIKNLPYYEIFGKEEDRKKDIKNTLELIAWLTQRKMKAN